MARYAVKIGEIQLRSEEPITTEQRREIIEKIKKESYGILIELLRDAVVRFVPDRC